MENISKCARRHVSQRFVEVIYLGALRHHFGQMYLTYEWVSDPRDAILLGAPGAQVMVTLPGGSPEGKYHYLTTIVRDGETKLRVSHVVETEYSLDYMDTMESDG